ncbi:cytochrome P450 [Radiomyces spectabilis]|uniref:cytochrome P450 n=1 Tax=Radiomyces spectabilis TaxID=64574 RepID=UPI00221FE37C|nr:cytochrome P450 [Radiomyces spectabilis]KAI8391100.1 cytochrome P450 [Radiomyces spectabilis]
MDSSRIIKYFDKPRKWSYLSAAVTLFLTFKVYKIFRVPSNLRHIPAVPYWCMIKAFLSQKSPQERFEQLTLPIIQRSKGIYLNKVPFEWTVYVADPIAAKTILNTRDIPKDQSVFHKLADSTPVVRLFGHENLPLSNGITWKKQRKLINPAFSRAVPTDALGNVMLRVYKNIDNYDGNRVEVLQLMRLMSLDGAGLAFFGLDFQALDGKEAEWTALQRELLNALIDPVQYVFPGMSFLASKIFPHLKSSNDAIDVLNQLILKKAHERRSMLQTQQPEQSGSTPNSEIDALTLMVEAEMKDEEACPMEELRANTAILFVAGYEVICHAIAFSIYHLAAHKGIQDKARREVLGILGDEPKDVIPTFAETQNMEYIHMIAKETLRISPPADTIWPRVTQEDTYICDTFIPKGTSISIDMHALQNRPDIWDQPAEFRPERFAKNGEHDQHEGLTWIPFSSGDRKCIATKYVMTQLIVCLAMLLRKYEWSVPEDSPHPASDTLFSTFPASFAINFSARY